MAKQIASNIHTRMRNLTELYYPDDEINPGASKLITALALFGVYCTTRKLYNSSKPLAEQFIASCLTTSNQSLLERYGSGWAFVLNTVDQMGNTYACQLAANGFNLVLCGPPVDLDRMHSQAAILRAVFKVRTTVLTID